MPWPFPWQSPINDIRHQRTCEEELCNQARSISPSLTQETKLIIMRRMDYCNVTAGLITPLQAIKAADRLVLQLKKSHHISNLKQDRLQTSVAYSYLPAHRINKSTCLLFTPAEQIIIDSTRTVTTGRPKGTSGSFKGWT